MYRDHISFYVGQYFRSARRKLPIAAFSVFALFFETTLFADPVVAPNVTLSAVGADDHLSLPFIVSGQEKIPMPAVVPAVPQISITQQFPVLANMRHESDHILESERLSLNAVGSSA